MLLLFKPWRQITDLKPKNSTWEQAFAKWQNSSEYKKDRQTDQCIQKWKQTFEQEDEAAKEREARFADMLANQTMDGYELHPDSNFSFDAWDLNSYDSDLGIFDIDEESNSRFFVLPVF